MKRLIGLQASAALIALALGASVLSMPAVAQTAASAAPQPEQASDGELLSDAELAGITRAIEFPGAYAKYKLKDYPEALARFQRMAANPDHDNAAESQFYLGEMAERGRGVAKDEAEAIRYYKLAAAGGESDGHYALGKIYSNNRNFADAATEFRKFVVKQDGYVGDKAEARYKLGKLYASGQGVPQDFALAAEQYALAIDLIGRHNDAHYELGKLYLEGKGVGQDYAKAAENFQIAAVDYEYRDQPGVVDAQYALGSLYGAGRGVAQSDAEAHAKIILKHNLVWA
jgi:uncharacterized protein